MIQMSTGAAEFESIVKERVNRKKLMQSSPNKTRDQSTTGETLTSVLGKGRGGRIGEEIKDLSSKLLLTIENLDVKVETAILRKENRLFQAVKEVITQRRNIDRAFFEDTSKKLKESERKDNYQQNSMEENIKKLYEFNDRNQEKKAKDLETYKIDNNLLKNEVEELREQIKKEKKANKEMAIAMSKGEQRHILEKLEGIDTNQIYRATKEFLQSSRGRSRCFPEYLKELLKKQKQSREHIFRPEEFLVAFDNFVLFMESRLEDAVVDYQTQIDNLLSKNKELIERVKLFSSKTELLKIWEDCVKSAQETIIPHQTKVLLVEENKKPQQQPLKKKLPQLVQIADDKKRDILALFFSRREVYEILKEKLFAPFQLLAQNSPSERTMRFDEEQNMQNNTTMAFTPSPTPDIKKFEINVHLAKKWVPPIKKSSSPEPGLRRIPAVKGIHSPNNVSF
jgi:hypothetical protein